MQNASRKHKQMPYKMHVFYILQFIKNYTDGICNTARKQEYKAVFRNNVDYCLHACKHRPTHYYIKNHGQLFPTIEVYGIKNNAQNRAKTIYSEKRPPCRTSQKIKAYRRVCTEYQNKNRTMIKYLKHMLCGKIRK